MDLRQANDLATGAPGTITLGEQVFLVAQPTDADFVTLRRHLRELFLQRARTPLKAIMEDLKGLPPGVQQEVLKAAVAQQAGGGSEPTSEALQQLLFEPDGCRFWVWLLARKHQPLLKLEELLPLITPETVDDTLAQLLRASGFKDMDPNVSGRPGSPR